MSIMSDKELFELVNNLSKQFFHKSYTDEVRFNNRLRTTGGRYIPAKRLIELNPKYLLEMGEEEFIGIIKHELCHYHLHIEGRGYKHGDRAFKTLLKQTGSPRHCQPLPSQRNKYRYIYVCVKCQHKYKRMRRVDVEKYCCGKCKGKLMLS